MAAGTAAPNSNPSAPTGVARDRVVRLRFPVKTRRQALRTHLEPWALVLPGLLALAHLVLTVQAGAHCGGAIALLVLLIPVWVALWTFESWFRRWRDDAFFASPLDVVLYAYTLALMGSAAIGLMAYRFGS